MTAKQLRNTMEKHNILIRDCSNYPGLSSEYIRVAVKQKKQNYILVDTLKRLLGGI